MGLKDADIALIALISDAVAEAQELLTRVETECKKVGLGLNGPKTKCLSYNIESPQPLYTRDGTELEYKADFKYLGSWVDDSEKDISLLPGHRRVNTAVRVRELVHDCSDGEVPRRYLHEDAKESTECPLVVT